jgi:hypothetical protein
MKLELSKIFVDHSINIRDGLDGQLPYPLKGEGL